MKKFSARNQAVSYKENNAYPHDSDSGTAGVQESAVQNTLNDNHKDDKMANKLMESKQVDVKYKSQKEIEQLIQNSDHVTFSFGDNSPYSGKDAFDPNACSKEAVGKEVLPFLWCTMGMCRGTKERIVEDGRFSVRLIGYWQKEPTVSQEGPSWCKHFRFMNEDKKNNKQWISIEHMVPLENMRTDGDIGTWVDMPRMITGKPMLDIPDKQDFTVLKFGRIKEADEVFMKKHGLKQMASYAGTIKIGETVCCVYMALMQKGRESWKMEVVFPASYEKGPVKEGAKVFCPVVNNDEELANVSFHPFNMRTAGLFIGHFRILE